jgi:uncharacterized membrane protein
MRVNSTPFRKPHLLVLVTIVVGFGLRLYNLGAQSLWYDETVSAYLASQPALDLIRHTALDIHPPGYYLLLRGWTQLAGQTEFALAFFSVGWGVMLIALGYRLARLLLGPDTARWCAVIIALSPFNLWYSQEVRMYTLGATLGLLATYFMLRALAPHSGQSWPFWIGYGLVAAAGLYVLYYLAFLFFAVNLFVAYCLFDGTGLPPKALRSWLLAQIAVLLLYLPWLPTAWRQASRPPVPPWRSYIPPWQVAVESWSALSLGESVRPEKVWPLLLIFLGLFAVGLAATARSRRRDPGPSLAWRTPALLVVYTFGSLLLLVGLSVVTPLYHVRYLFTFAPAFYLVIAAGLAWLFQRSKPLAIIASTLILGGNSLSVWQLYTNPLNAADDLRAASQMIVARWRPGDVVLVNAGYTYTALEYYADGQPLSRIRLSEFEPSDERVIRSARQPLLVQVGTVSGPPSLGFGDPSADFYPMSEADTIAALEALAERYQRIWLLRVYDTVTDANGLIRSWLHEQTRPQFEDQVFAGTSNIRVQGFLTGPPAAPLLPAQVLFASGLELAGYTPPSARASAGQTLDVALWWRPRMPLDKDYAVSLKLLNSAGKLAAQADEWPLGSTYFTSAWAPETLVRHPMRLILPNDLPAGQYWLNVEIYDPAHVQPLQRLDGKGHLVNLGPVTVTNN